MPVSVKNSPFSRSHSAPQIKLRTPQARILAVLQPMYTDDPVSEWPLITRPQLGVLAGYTAISGTVTRALNGIQPGSSSGDPHLGLLALGYVEEVEVDVCGVLEISYRTTIAGILVYKDHLASGRVLPPVKDATTCINDRYRRDG